MKDCADPYDIGSSASVVSEVQTSLDKVVVASVLSSQQRALLDKLKEYLAPLDEIVKLMNGETTYQRQDIFYEIDIHDWYAGYKQNKSFRTLDGLRCEALEVMKSPGNSREAVRLTICPYYLEIDFSEIEKFCKVMRKEGVPYLLHIVPVGVISGKSSS
ncbi:hypothetical protein J4421_04975 [Candidatus Woesearchaeota archaeon]|nr:hypothetical protein [Candidatus Woesearchaeota archaeon]